MDNQVLSGTVSSSLCKMNLNLSDRAKQDQPEVTGTVLIDLEIFSEVLYKLIAKNVGIPRVSCWKINLSNERKCFASANKVRPVWLGFCILLIKKGKPVLM